MKHIKEFELNENATPVDSFRKEIMDAYIWIRKNNSTIPDEVLDFMKDAAIEKLDSKTKESILLLKFRTEDIYHNKHTLAVNQRSDDSIGYSFFSGWQSSGMGNALSNMMMKKSLPSSVKGFSNIKQLQSEIQSCIDSGVGEKVMKVEEINKIRK
jgi:hypothetical protein